MLKLNRTDEAIASYREALSIRPEYPEALQNLSGLLCDGTALDEAIELARRALACSRIPPTGGTTLAEPCTGNCTRRIGRCVAPRDFP